MRYTIFLALISLTLVNSIALPAPTLPSSVGPYGQEGDPKTAHVQCPDLQLAWAQEGLIGGYNTSAYCLQDGYLLSTQLDDTTGFLVCFNGWAGNPVTPVMPTSCSNGAVVYPGHPHGCCWNW